MLSAGLRQMDLDKLIASNYTIATLLLSMGLIRMMEMITRQVATVLLE